MPLTKRFSTPLLTGALFAALLFSSGCLNDLDVAPPYGLNEEQVYSDPNNYINVLAKIYAGLSTTGNDGPAGSGDLAGIDEGFSSYLRCLWNLQVMTTDEAICAWEQDNGVPELNRMTVSSLNIWVQGMYYRIFFQVPLCNEFIRQSTDERMSDRGFSADEQERIRAMRNEVRYLRALSYYHALDLFGNPPFVTEDDLPGAFNPEQITRPELFDYVESELLELESLLAAPGTNDYGRVDQGALWMTLAHLYLNAEVYIGVDRYSDAATYAKKVIDAGAWSLDGDYEWLFLADNHQSNEIIFPITHDGLRTQSYGGAVYLTHAPVGGQMDAADFGVNSGWAGLRSTPQFVRQFPDSINDTRYNFFKGDSVEYDSRSFDVDSNLNSITFDSAYAITSAGDTTLLAGGYFVSYPLSVPSGGEVVFYGLNIYEPHTFSISNAGEFTEGYGVIKFKNIDRMGNDGSDPTGNFVDTDWPFYRLADAYLIYAECAARGAAGAEPGIALNLLQELLQRAYEGATPPTPSLDLDFILAERSRELYWEMTRRSDLIRFGKFLSGYDWAFKGGVVQGTDIDDRYLLYPLPASDLASNPNLVQNPGH
jgi:hypothetical protein